MAKAVSVIIPLYNSEKEVARCIESVLAQTLSSIEVIVVDDGSTDDGRKIVEQFRLRDSRITLINGPNSGPSAARNRGLSESSGEYIVFFDSDDWVEPDMLKIMYNAAVENNVDVVLCAFARELLQDGKRAIVQYEGLQNGVVVGRSVITDVVQRSLLRTGIYSGLWNKIYRREYIQSEKIDFDETRDFCEDWKFQMQIFDNLDRLYYINIPFYHWTRRVSAGLSRKYRPDLFENTALWMYRLRSEYARKWQLPLSGAARDFVDLTIDCIRGDFSKTSGNGIFQAVSRLRSYLQNKEVNEALSEISTKGSERFVSFWDLSLKYRLYILIVAKCVFQRGWEMFSTRSE